MPACDSHSAPSFLHKDRQRRKRPRRLLRSAPPSLVSLSCGIAEHRGGCSPVWRVALDVLGLFDSATPVALPARSAFTQLPSGGYIGLIAFLHLAGSHYTYCCVPQTVDIPLRPRPLPSYAAPSTANASISLKVPPTSLNLGLRPTHWSLSTSLNLGLRPTHWSLSTSHPRPVAISLLFYFSLLLPPTQRRTLCVMATATSRAMGGASCSASRLAPSLWVLSPTQRRELHQTSGEGDGVRKVWIGERADGVRKLKAVFSIFTTRARDHRPSLVNVLLSKQSISSAMYI
ncbi:hypothetical protein B0H19DRAFT_1273255 [Mycena capillaripes]|nr:hypothetical protein B0H19DRAFT_1273255 [Mycena capillaripes]